MAIDLADLVEDLKTEVNPPGRDIFPTATDDQYLNNLRNAFWSTVIDGVITGYTESDGVVKPTSGTSNLSRELQQLIIFYAAYHIIQNHLLSINTRFRAQAGSVEYETEQSASILKAIYDSLTSKRNYILSVLSQQGTVSSIYIDAVQAREDSFLNGLTFWIN